jgi:hypothetical protein
MPIYDGQDMQIDLFGGERPTSELPRMNCTNDEQCKAEADEHLETCPVEQKLRDDLGF